MDTKLNIGLVQVDGKIPNLALMKIAGYHEAMGDTVSWFNGMLFADQYEKVYASKIFDFSEMPQLPECASIGGTGVDFYNTLETELENADPSYSLYPNWTSHIGFTMKGCRFNCSFCCVPKKEGRPKDVSGVDDLLTNPNGGDRLMLLDNDFFGGSEWMRHLRRIRELDLRVCFAQGLNIRVLTYAQASLLATVRFMNTKFSMRMVTFAWDKMKDEKLIFDGIALCESAGIRAKDMQFFVLIGYDTTPEEDYCRVTKLFERGALPFVMPYDKSDHYQKRFARWVNHRAIFKSVEWKDYK